MATVTPYKRELPFIHRTWKSAVDSLSQYGRKLTTANGDSPVNGDEGPRMAKRRRLDEDSLESALNGAMENLIPETMDDFEKVFRVQVLKIIRNGTPAFQPETLLNIAKSPAKKDTPNIRIRCRLTIYYYKDRPHQEFRALYSDNQICTIKVFQDGDDPAPMARIYLSTPFHIPAEKIYVEREDGRGFSLNDQYMIGVELESAGDPRWPPQDLLPKADASDGVPNRRQHWVLSTQFIYRFDKHRWTSAMKLRKRPGEDLPTDFRMDTDLRWSTGHPMETKTKFGMEESPPDIKPSRINGALEPLTNGNVNGRVEHLADEYAKDIQDMMMDDDEEPEEATTPSRSLRHREKQNYNLKLLSDKARGKEKKERKRRKAAEAEAEMKAGQVIWILPQTGRVPLEKFACLRCFAEHSSMARLKEHLECHTEYKYSYPPGGNFVIISLHDQATPRIPKSYLIDPQSIHDHDSDLEEHASPQRPRRSHSRSKTQQPSIIPPKPPKPRDTKLLIPRTEVIYDPLSKQVLEPGSRVDPPQVGTSWLLQKHRDIIRDYSDLLPGEKEFITEWDAFVIQEGVTTEPHLQEVYLAFVRQKASWLLAYQSRIAEFAKQLSYLAARRALADETIDAALDILREEKMQKRAEHPERPKTPSPRAPAEFRKSVSGCAVCGQSVRGPSTLVCANPECERPLHHDDCIREDAVVPVESSNWRCNECHLAEGGDAEKRQANSMVWA